MARTLKARFWTRAVTFLPPLLFLGMAGAYCVKLSRVLDANLPAVASREAGNFLHREVRIRAIHLSPLALTVSGLAVSNKETFAKSHSETLASADRVSVHYNLHDLVFDSKNAAHAIGDIDLLRPTALVEVLPGKLFNFSDLLVKKKKPPQKPYDGRILVTDGVVTLRDFTAPANAKLRPAVNKLSQINTIVDLHSERYVYFTGTAQGDGRRIANVSASGDASRTTAGRFRAQVQVSDADAAYWSTYFKDVPNFRVLSGRAKADITVSRLGSKPAPGLPLDIFGLVTARNGTIKLTDPRVRRLPLTQVAGTATFTGASVVINGTALAGRENVRFGGTIANFLDPQVAFSGAADNVNALRFASYFPQLNLPPGLSAAPASVRVRVTGSAKDPVWGVDASAAALHLQGQTANNVQAHALFAGGILSLPSVSFSVGGGMGKLRATINTLTLPSPTVTLGGRVDNMNLAALPLPKAAGKPLELGGRADAAFLVTGTAQKPSVVANVHVLNPKVAQTAFRSLKGRVAWQFGQTVTVRRAVLDDGRGGVLLASGTVPLPNTRKQWNLAVNASGADIHALLAPYLKAAKTKPLDVAGVAYAQAQIIGPFAQPAVQGDVQIYGGRFNNITTDAVTGHIATNGDTLKLTNVTVRRFPESLSVSGTVGSLRSGNPTLDLAASVPEADVTDLLALARQAAGKSALATLPTLTGAVTAQVQVGGMAQRPRVSGHAALADATVGAYRIQSAQADASFDGTTVRVSDFQLREQDTGATVNGRGLWNTKSGKIAAAINAEDVNLSLLRPFTSAYTDLRGTLSGSVTARGTTQSPIADVRVAGQDLTIDGQNLAPLTLAGRYAAGAFTKTAPPWTLTFLPADGGPVSYTVDALRVALPSPQNPKRPIALAVRASVPESAPESLTHLLNTVRDSRFAARPAVQNFLAQVDALPSLPTGTVWIPTLTARGPIDAPTVSADVRAQNLALGPDRLESLTASVSYAGGANPDVQAQLSAAKLTAAGVMIDTVTAKGGYSNRVVQVSTLDARSQSAYLHGSGRADLDGTTDAALDVSDVPLSLFSSLLNKNGGPRRALSGTVSALTVQASGQTQSPQLVASVTLTKPGLATAASAAGGEASQFTLDLIRSGAVTLAAPAPGTNTRVLSVADLAAFKAGRQIASVSGSVPLALTGGAAGVATGPSGEPLSATARVSDLSVLAAFAPAVVDPARTGGSLTATVRADKNGQLQGAVDITNGALGIAGFDTGLQKVNGRVLLSGGRVQVQNLVLPSTRGGQMTVAGGATLAGNGNLNLQVTAQKFKVDETGKSSLLARTYGSGGSGTLDGRVAVGGPFLSPLVSTLPDAPLVVSGANVSLPTTTPPVAGTKTASAFNPRFDLAVLLGGAKSGTVSARSSLLRADARGDLLLNGDLQNPVLRSHLTVARGQFFLPPSTTLKVVRPASGQDNTVDLKYDATNPVVGPDGTVQPGLETRVDLTAQATVSVSDATRALGGSAVGGASGIGAPSQQTLGGGTVQTASGSRQKQRYTITAHITGLLNVPDKLTLDLSSSPPGLSKSQMLAALVQEDALGSLLAGGGGAENAVKTQIGQAFYAAGVSSLLFPIENSVIDTFGLSDFSVNYAPDAPTLVTLSKELAPRLLATYTRLLGSRASGPLSVTATQPQYTLKLGYNVAGHLQVSVSTDDQKDNTLALEGIFGF